MDYIYPEYVNNPRGANPETSIFMAIVKGYPSYGITQANSKIIATQPFVTDILPYGKRVLVQKGDNPNDRYAFYYTCRNVPDVFKATLLTAAQVVEAVKFKTSAELITYIGLVNNLNMRPEDWWCSTNSIDYTGGTKRPNFLLEAKYNAQWYSGKSIIHLWV